MCAPEAGCIYNRSVTRFPVLFLVVNDKALFVITKHGGHLGFYEAEGAGLLTYGAYTWLDKAVVQYASAVLLVTASGVAASVKDKNYWSTVSSTY